MRKRTISSWRWAGLVCLLLAIATPSLCQQSNSSAGQNTISHLIKFNGTLHDLSGKSITGPVDVTFSLYAQQSGGSALWFETQTVQADALGNYTVLLGAMTPSGVPMELFTSGEAHWLGVQVSNLPEQSRVLLVSVPYAMKAGDAETLGGKPASDYVLSSQAATDSTSTTTTSLTNLITSGATKTTTTTSTESPVTNAITASTIPVFTDSLGTLANSIMTQSGAKLGINTSTPAFNLDLNGAVFMIGPKAAAPGAGGTMRFRDDTGTQRWLFGIPGTAGSQDFQMYNYSNGHAPLFIQNGAASYSLYLAGSGNVGIGTTSPARKLDVNGDIHASGTFYGNGSGLTNVGSSSTVILGSTATFTGDVSTSSNLDLPATTNASAGVINLNGVPFIHSCCANSTQNTFVGPQAGSFTADASGSSGGTGINTGVGYLALASLTGGFENTGVGAYALYANTTGVLNTAFGFDALTSTTLGVENTAAGYNALSTNTTGNYNTAMGLRADVATGNLNFATAIGACSKVSASNALVLGAVKDGCQSGAPTASTKVGIGTTSPIAPLEVVSPGALEARFRNDGTGSDHTALIDTENGDGVLWRQGVGGTGNGLSLASGQYYIEQSGHGARLVIDTGGKIGIGTSSPEVTLEVDAAGAHPLSLNSADAMSGECAASNCTGVDGVSSGDSGDGVLAYATGSNGVALYAKADGSATTAANFQGEVGVTGDLTVSGCVTGSNLPACSSDERLKTNIRPFNPSLDRLAELQLVHFNWRPSNPGHYPKGSALQTGLIAQQVKKIFPGMVRKDKTGYYTVNYSMLPLLLLSGVRQLKTRNDNLRAEIGRDEQQIATLRKTDSQKDAELAAMKSQIKQLRRAQEQMALAVARMDSRIRNKDTMVATRLSR